MSCVGGHTFQKVLQQPSQNSFFKKTNARKPLLSHYGRILKLRWNPDKKTLDLLLTAVPVPPKSPLSCRVDPESLQVLDLLLT